MRLLSALLLSLLSLSTSAQGQTAEEFLKDMFLIEVNVCISHKPPPPVKLYCETFTDGRHRYLVFYDTDSEVMFIKEVLENGMQVDAWPSGNPA